MNDLIKMRIFELLSEASQEVTNDELQSAYGELLEHIRCVRETQQTLVYFYQYKIMNKTEICCKRIKASVSV